MTRKKITLPSGATAVVRKMSAGDIAINTGDVPVIDGKAAGGKASRADMLLGAQYMRIAILFCCSPLTMPDARRLRIVEKDLDRLADGEIALGEVADADAQEIFNAVAELSGLRKEAAEANSFPEQQETPGTA